MLRIAIRDASGERVFTTERAEILVGSREGVDLRLDGAEPNHCILRAEGGAVRVLSLSSAGTAVAGRRVVGAMLAPGQGFEIGSATLRIVDVEGASRLALEEPPAAPPGPPAIPPPPAHVEAATSDSEFAREVRETLAKAPWYLLSLTAHVVLLLFLSLLQVPQAPVDRVAHMTATPPEPIPEPEVPPDVPLALSSIEAEKDQLDMVEIEEPLSAAVEKAPSDGEYSELEDAMPPDRLGILSGRHPLKKLDTPLPIVKVKGGDETLNKADLEGEQGRAMNEVERNLGDGLRQAQALLTKDHIFVVRGAYDKIEDLLDGYHWPYTLVSRDELLMHGCPKARILFVNCSTRPGIVMSQKLGALVKQLLLRGCWVVTSDWSVDPYLTEAFKGVVWPIPSTHTQRDTTVEVEPAGRDDLLEGVFSRRGEHHWWLEDSSMMVRVSRDPLPWPTPDHDRVTVLVTSDDMKTRYGSEVVAFKFPYGEGMVVHLVGHFYQKDGTLRGLVAMHRLLNNVILERVLGGKAR
jgi:hypothetical protein